ncbi:MAG: LysR family transcriptional regulator, partial [Propionibacteriaceae bacterium]|jgi:molybdate transport repressor ModE-like protein|nr:LysR family transcriptional regulator [Propionibacteriaceae bacterium]
MDVDPRRLIIFRAVADAGSISAGARRLGWTQPSVTAHIKALEQAVGTPLLLRGATGVTPTEAGEILLAHAHAIASHLEAAAQETTELRSLHRGVVRVAAYPSGLATLLPRALNRLRDAGAGVEVRLTEASPETAVTLLTHGEADIAVTFRHDGDLAAADLGDFVTRPLGRDEVRLVLPAGDPLAARADLRLADLAEVNWIFGFTRCHAHMLRACLDAGFNPRVRHETDDYVVVQALVSQGLAAAVLTESALAAHRHPDVAVRELPELTGHALCAACRPGAERVPSVRAVLGALTEAAGVTA